MAIEFRRVEPWLADCRPMRFVPFVIAWLIVACGSVATPTAFPQPSATETSAGRVTATATPGPTPSPTQTPIPTMLPATELEAELIRPGSLTTCISVVGAVAAGLDEDGQLVGYNVDFAEAIADRLGLTLRTREPLFDALIDLIREHECDIAVSSQNITASRQELIDFVPYTESIQPVLVALGNPLPIDELGDLCGKRVSATEGTTHVDLVNGTGDYIGQGLNDQCSAEGRAPIELQAFETESHAATALLTGDVVAYLGNPTFAFEFPNRIEYSPATLPPARQGITIAKDRPAIHAAIAATLSAMMSDGSYEAILRDHLPDEESVDRVSVLE
jgi:polar amino acid transport system substrate-binding protein